MNAPLEPAFTDMLSGATALSPYGQVLGLKVAKIEQDRAVFELPFDERLVTVGDIVHGGAIASLIDACATAAVWATPDLPENPRGLTIGFSLNYLDAARGQKLTADASVIRRGGSVCVATVTVTDEADRPVAHATVTYKLSGKPSGKPSAGKAA